MVAHYIILYMGRVRIGRSSAPVVSSIRWLIIVLVLWAAARLLADTGPNSLGSWPLSFFELLALVPLPAFAAFAFVRLFLAVVQSASGSLNTYTLTASPWAVVFWLSLATALLGYGSRITASALLARMPDLIRHGDFARMITFFHDSLSLLLVGAGFFGVTAVILVLGRGAAPPVFGLERPLTALGSLLTYGYAVLYLALVAQGAMFIPALLGSAGLAGFGLWLMGGYEATQDPVGLLVIPGNLAAAATLIVWALVIGGRPVWPL